MTQIDELEAGFEMDARVAEALGCAVLRPYPWLQQCLCTDRPHAEQGTDLAWLKKYSTDWNASMAAAEAVFGDKPIHIIRGDAVRPPSGFTWTVWYDKGGRSTFVRAPTGPLAICRAILLFKEQDDAE